MNAIDQRLEKIKKEKRIGLMTHVVVGYPSITETEKIVEIMAQTGVDMVELQIPFSDPLADGPTIMRACEDSLKNGTKVKDAFDLANRLSKKVSIPLLFMAYFNNVFKYGPRKFCIDAKKNGISGLIVPDMPIEEEDEEHFMKYCDEFNLHHIRVISPASTEERLKKNAAVADGFVYATARQGITGAKTTLDPNLINFLKRVKREFKIPLAVGFGISKKEHIKILKPYADIAVLGSVLIDIINKSQKSEMEKKIKKFLTELTFNTQKI